MLFNKGVTCFCLLQNIRGSVHSACFCRLFHN